MDIRSMLAAAVAATTVALTMTPLTTEAQERWSLEGRVGAAIPTGDLTDGPTGQTAGLSFGADLMYTLTTNFTLYGGANHVGFNCDDCDTDVSSMGADAGVKLLFGSHEGAMPWVRAGLLLHRFEVDDTEGDWETGIDAGVGIDWRMSDRLSLVPAARYRTYGTDGGTFSWFNIDLGAHLHLGG